MIYAAIQILRSQRQEKLDAILSIFNDPCCQSVCDILKKQIAELDIAIQILLPFEKSVNDSNAVVIGMEIMKNANVKEIY